jgi:hypothetical protein
MLPGDVTFCRDVNQRREEKEDAVSHTGFGTVVRNFQNFQTVQIGRYPVNQIIINMRVGVTGKQVSKLP